MLTGEPWERLGIDITGPHPTSSKGNVYILTVIDHFTKWVELFPMRNQEAPTVAKLLFEGVICRHGCPIQILTDQGPNFESHLFQELNRLLSIDKIRTTPYRPSTNGNIERFHGTMHSMLAKLVSDNQRDWDQKLPAVAFAYRTSVHETTRFTPYFLMYGREARIPADLVYGPPPDELSEPRDTPEFVQQQSTALQQAYESVRQNLGLAARRRKHQYDLRSKPQTFSVGSLVWVLVPRRRPQRYMKWQCLYQGPYRIVRQLGPVNYLVQRSPKSRPWVVHVDKLKPCVSTEADEPPPDHDTEHHTDHSTTQSPEARPRRTIRPPVRFRDA